ncbi:FAD-dependent pyridine nucleotide-disulfide oxidoreductase [Candidatus Magnetomorum sp. HK-1]|nr:FAD-dependent pyridine nucleotide-disulfide oxidoreductase [Candidatus Magnetomorum sp. HK-1]
MSSDVTQTQNALRLVIVGGVAAGASAAARARRLSEKASISILERGEDISFANCGLPYHIGGEIVERDALAIHTPESLSQLLNVDIFVRTEATRIDRERKVVIAYDHTKNEEKEFPYDKLLLAPGAKPIRPPMPGIDDKRIQILRNLQDMDAIKSQMENAQNVLVIGAGFIGLEMVEMLVHLGKTVHLVELQDQVLPVLDKEMVKHIQVELIDNGVDLILGDGIASFEPKENALLAHLNSGKTIESDLVILSIGVQCESKLAEDANLELGIRKSIKVNSFQQTSDPDIYAAGDVAETADPILDKRVIVPLGGPANRQGRVAADHIFLGEKAKQYPGTIGTSIVRVFNLAAGITGYSEKRLKTENVDYKSVIVTANQHAGYYPGAVQLTLKILWSKEDGRLLGGQAYGFDGVDKRLDVLSTAIKGGLDVDELCHLELAYAPPFGSARDVINIAGFAAQNINDGLFDPVYELPTDPQIQIIDVRPKENADLQPVKGAVNIPMSMLRGRLGELDQKKPVVTVCALGKMSYFAARVLEQNGFDVSSMIGGMNVKDPKPMEKKKESKHIDGENTMENYSIEPLNIDACGLACPGPIMKLKESIQTLQPGQELIAKASDPGFASDFNAFCNANGLDVISVSKEKGIVIARAKKSTQEPQQGIAVKSQTGATLVVFSCELDKVLAAFVIANGAAAMNGEVTMFFTFWGLNALRKDMNTKSLDKDFMDKMFGKMMPKGIDALPLSRMHMGGMGTRMMKWRMDSKNLPSLEGLMADAKKSGIRMVACSMSMDAMGITQDELIDGVEIGGVADFLNACNQTQTNLFI